MLELYLASNNAHKAVEFKTLLDPTRVKVLPSPKKIEVIEDGDTYNENALKKAEAYYSEFKKPVFSDDSGLNVEALPEELGIHSARFGGDGLNDQDRYILLLKKLNGLKNSKRRAYFSCTLCFYMNPKEIFFFEGRVYGMIAEDPSGSAGFGYDPVFIPDGYDGKSTLAMLPQWKDKNSHRANAAIEANKFFKERVCQKGNI